MFARSSDLRYYIQKNNRCLAFDELFIVTNQSNFITTIILIVLISQIIKVSTGDTPNLFSGFIE